MNNFKGVVYKKDRECYRASIVYKKSRIYLGTFDDEISAAQAYNNESKKLFGESAYLNQVPDNPDVKPRSHRNGKDEISFHGSTKDLMGQRFETFEVIEKIRKRNLQNRFHNYWKFKCVICGFERITETSKVRKRRRCDICLGIPKGDYGLIRLYDHSYKVNANKRNLSFELSLDEFRKLTSMSCHYCGKLPNQVCGGSRDNTKSAEWARYIYNGIDRKDNAIGYTLNNSVPCCGFCNKAKMKMPYLDFVAQLDSLAKFRYHLTTN